MTNQIGTTVKLFIAWIIALVRAIPTLEFRKPPATSPNGDSGEAAFTAQLAQFTAQLVHAVRERDDPNIRIQKASRHFAARGPSAAMTNPMGTTVKFFIAWIFALVRAIPTLEFSKPPATSPNGDSGEAAFKAQLAKLAQFTTQLDHATREVPASQ